MVEAWWLVVAGAGGVMIGMFLFAVMSIAGEEPQADVVTPRMTNAMN